MDPTLPPAQVNIGAPTVQSHGDYSVGWISVLPLELTAARAMLDHVHPSLPQSPQDDNIYTLGVIGRHNVVMACLPYGKMGNNSAASIATQMRSTFPAIRFGLMVGIGGGCPSAEHDIRLGDVVVSKPGKHDGGVIQYDFGRTVEEGRFIRNGVLNAPPTVLLNAASAIEAALMLSWTRIEDHLCAFESSLQQDKYIYQGWENDLLFQSDYDHNGNLSTCQGCDKAKLVVREKRRTPQAPVIHYGTIVSGNQVIRHGATREWLREQTGALCFEMEAAGLMDNFPCLVVRGICDYADSHKSKVWQDYAAATAAAYAKELLSVIPVASASVLNPPPSYEHDDRNDQPDTSTSVTALSCGPFQRNPFFSGRKSILESIDTRFRNSTFQQAYILQGMGGIGKTQIALEYSYLALEKGFHVFWVNCTTPESLRSDFQKLQRTMNWLDCNRNWVLVFDNADDSQFPYGDWIPIISTVNVSSRQILFTTRDERLADAIVNIKENVPLMDQSESVHLFNIHTSKTTGVSNRSSRSVIALVERLGNLPLAITLASAYLREYPWVTIEEYLKLLQDFSDRSKLFGYKRSFSNYNHSIMSTWEVSFIKVRMDSPRAAELLTVLGFLENKGVPFDRLRRASCSIEMDKLQFLQDNATLHQSLGLLRSLALIYFDGTILSLHPLVHEWIQARLNEEELVAWGMTTLRVIYHAWLADLYPQSGVIPISGGWFEHTVFALSAIQRLSFSQFEVHEECYFLLLIVLVIHGRLAEVIRPVRHHAAMHPDGNISRREPRGTVMLTHRTWANETRRERHNPRLVQISEIPGRLPYSGQQLSSRRNFAMPEGGSSRTEPILPRFDNMQSFLMSSFHHSTNVPSVPSELTSHTHSRSDFEQVLLEPRLSIGDTRHSTVSIDSCARRFGKRIRRRFHSASSVCAQMALALIELRIWWERHQFTVPVDVGRQAGDSPHLAKLQSFLSICDLIPTEEDDETLHQFPSHIMWVLFTYTSCAAMNVGKRIEMAMERHIEPLKIVLLQKAHQICRHINSQSREDLLLDAAISYARFVDQRSLGASYWLPVQSCLIGSMNYVFSSETPETTDFVEYLCQSMWELDHELALRRFARFIALESVEERISFKWTERLLDRWRDLQIEEHSYQVRSSSEQELLMLLSAMGID